MATTSLTRNLRDGELKVEDGAGTPNSATLALDEGDLSWTETDNTIDVLDRGTLDHTRPGDEEPVELSFTFKWVQLIANTAASADDDVLYEMVNNLGDTYTSVADAGEQFALKYTFTVSDPDTSTAAGEVITFAEVYKTSLECSEGDEYNTVSFSGRDFETKPSIARTA